MLWKEEVWKRVYSKDCESSSGLEKLYPEEREAKHDKKKELELEDYWTESEGENMDNKVEENINDGEGKPWTGKKLSRKSGMKEYRSFSIGSMTHGSLYDFTWIKN